MKKLILIYVIAFLSSCNIYDITFNVNTRQGFNSEFKGAYASILNNIDFLNNVDFIGETFRNNGIELTILYAFALGDRENDRIFYRRIYNEETEEWLEDKDSPFIPINSYVLFSIKDTLDRVDFLSGNKNTLDRADYLSRDFEFEFGFEFGISIAIDLFLEYYDNGTAYFLARNTYHEIFYGYEFYEEGFTGETNIGFSLESILLDSYPYVIEVGIISNSFYSNVLMIDDF